MALKVSSALFAHADWPLFASCVSIYFACEQELMAERIRGEHIEKMYASKCSEHAECRAELAKALQAQKSLVF
jgi:hypothetical protein